MAEVKPRNYVKELQEILKDAGYYTGSIDGIVGQLTVSAVYKAVNYPNDRGDNRQEKEEDKGQVISSSPAQDQDFADFINATSKKRLEGVKPNLIKVVALASKYTTQPFMVVEGLRSYARQEELVRTGASKTMNSNHLTGKAVDLAPLVNGNLSWVQSHFYEIVIAMRKAAIELNISIRWGGAWEVLNHTGALTPKALIDRYVATKREKKQSPFIDCPHFELYGV